MKILVVTQYFYPEIFRINSLCIELVNRGYEVDVLTGYPQYPQGKIYDGYGFTIDYNKEWNGINIHRVRVKPRGSTALGLLQNCISFVVEANKWVKKCTTEYDCVFVFEVSPVTVGLPAIKYKEKFSKPVIFNVQDLWPENVEYVLGVKNKLILSIIDNIVDYIYKNSDNILCSSKSFVKNLKNRGVSQEKLMFWPQFCDKPDFNNSVKPECYEEDWFNIVFAGNIGEAQGLDLLIDSAVEIRKLKVRWYIVGDGRAKNKLQNRIKQENLEDKVIFVGKVSEQEANSYVHYADCAYLSFSDNPIFDMTIPAKLQTYLACGTPIIAAAGGESAEIISKAHCGLAVKREKNQIVNAVETLMNTHVSKLEEMRIEAQKYFSENFDKSILVDKLEKIILCKKVNNKYVEENYV